MDHTHMRAAVQAADRLPDKRADRTGVYPLRANRDELRARAALYPVADRRVQAVTVDPPTRPAA